MVRASGLTVDQCVCVGGGGLELSVFPTYQGTALYLQSSEVEEPAPPRGGLFFVCSSIHVCQPGMLWRTVAGQPLLKLGTMPQHQSAADHQQSAGMDLTFPFPQHINELTMKLSVEDVLTRAEALYRQLTACPVSL